MLVKKKMTAKKKMSATKKKVSSRTSAMERRRAKKLIAIRTPMTQAQMATEIAVDTGFSRTDVITILESFGDQVYRHLKSRSCGQVKVLGMFNVNKVKKPARKARKGINPFTGEQIMIKAKPATQVIKVRPLKGLKEMAE